MATGKLAGAVHGVTGATAGGERGAVDVAIIGATGRVGRRVLDLIDTRRVPLQRSGIRLRVIAAANSRRLLAAPDGLPFDGHEKSSAALIYLLALDTHEATIPQQFCPTRFAKEAQ